MAADTYHHGNLRATLISVAAELVSDAGVESVTMRSLSRVAGVSRAAPYRHFADKRELLAAVAEVGFLELDRRLSEVEGRAAPGSNESVDRRAALAELMRVYVGFALDRPGHYRLMFSPDVVRPPRSVSLQEAAARAFERSLGAIRLGQQCQELRDGDPAALASIVWSAVHGLSVLLLDGQVRMFADGSGGHALLARDDEEQGQDVESFIELTIDVVLDGLGPSRKRATVAGGPHRPACD